MLTVRITYKVNMAWWERSTRGRLRVQHYGSSKHVTTTDASHIHDFVHSARVIHSYIGHAHSCSTAHTLKKPSTFFSKEPKMAEDLLKSLNSAQTRCVFQVASCSIIRALIHRTGVTHRPDFPLQILAGPGSGKTKVLTSRIAYMILHHGMDPSSICAVTFTNKAANEMRARLVKLIGKDSVNKVKLGTFHAICALFLRKYGTSVGLDGNFTICDSDERYVAEMIQSYCTELYSSKRIVTKLLKPYDDFLSSKDIQVNAATLCSLISRAKSKGETPEDVVPRKESRHVSSKASSSNSTNEEFQRVFAEIYRDYEKTLRKSNSLDFDDLLLFGVSLFSQHPRYAAWCQHILVDEL